MPTTKAVSRWRIALDTRLLDDLEKGTFAATIVKMGPQSPLITIPAIAASIAAIAKKAAALKDGNEAVDADEKQLKADVTTRDTARVSLDTELVSLKALLGNNATQASDITGLGYTLIELSQTTAKPEPPLVLVKIGKQHGKAQVSVAGKVRGRFVAESAPASTGPWTNLVGTGKSRKLSGYATGTQIWVHMAQVRYGAQSDWSTPVLVTIP